MPGIIKTEAVEETKKRKLEIVNEAEKSKDEIKQLKKKLKKEKKEKKHKKEKKEKKEKKHKKEKKEKKEKEESKEIPSSEISTIANENNGIWSYQEHEEISNLSESELNQFWQKNNIEFKGDEIIRPILEFKHSNFPEDIRNVLKNFQKPTPIQSSCWPIVMKKRDCIGIAKTGSGKTLTFLVPSFIHLKYNHPESFKSKKISVLVVAPTRELAMQTYDNAKEFGEPLGIKSLCIYGGVPKIEQKNALRKNVHILIATPGRLLDLINEGACDISNVNLLVLDEADRMLDNGFEQDIRNIISNTRSDRQTVMFSATWPQVIQKLAHEFLKNPIHITIGSAELHANENIKQIVEVIDPKQKEFRLIELLKKYHKTRNNRVLVFALYKKEAVRLENFLQRRGYNVASIHGDKSQDQRIQALNNFKSGSCPLLIATDVAARGLDIPNVEYVLNYTFPLTIEDYIHRIGRTGRAGSSGVSHTLFTQYDKAHAGELSNVLRDAKQEVPEALRNFGGTVKKKEHKIYGAFFRDIDPNAKSTHVTFDD
ncbi:DEAD-domain-containing protein [Piromyces finnis]|uniref:RNA helicase n=1 Tax=Piromyces finnis TaxID=1754191 RepID=A0A1Y1VJD6_9FUNG|nr:DEAD-domain-containing protein [Piromyces finnis]|eukprot:ORX56516.1 DEAD-domain-containing protein [Piromyces finnis]